MMFHNTLDSRALFLLFTEEVVATGALRELRVGIATLKGPVVQIRRKRSGLVQATEKYPNFGCFFDVTK